MHSLSGTALQPKSKGIGRLVASRPKASGDDTAALARFGGVSGVSFP